MAQIFVLDLARLPGNVLFFCSALFQSSITQLARFTSQCSLGFRFKVTWSYFALLVLPENYLMGQKIALNTYKPSPYRLKVLFCSLGSARSKILGCWDIWKLWAMLRLHRPVAPRWGEAEMLDCPPQTAELTWAAVSQPSAQPGAQILFCQNSPKWDAHASKSNTNVCWAILSSLFSHIWAHSKLNPKILNLLYYYLHN